MPGLREFNRQLKADYPLPYEAAGLLPVVGQVQAGLNYADAMEAGDREEAVQAALSAIPVVGKYKLGTTAARSVQQLADPALSAGRNGLRGWMNNIGRRVGAGEQGAEMLDAGYQEGLRLQGIK